MIETALVLPLLLLVCVGILEFGRAYQTWQVLTNAAREGARVAVLPGVNDSTVQNRVQEYMVAGRLPNAGIASVSIDRNQPIDIGPASTTASQVTVNYPFSFIVLGPIAELATGQEWTNDSLTMVASATMRNE